MHGKPPGKGCSIYQSAIVAFATHSIGWWIMWHSLLLPCCKGSGFGYWWYASWEFECFHTAGSVQHNEASWANNVSCCSRYVVAYEPSLSRKGRTCVGSAMWALTHTRFYMKKGGKSKNTKNKVDEILHSCIRPSTRAFKDCSGL